MSFQKGLREIWDDLMSYRTLKVVKISDQRLAYVHKSLMASILVYSTLSMIGSHTYMLKEKPRMYVDTTVDDSLRLANFSAADAPYCRTDFTDFAGRVPVPQGYLPEQRVRRALHHQPAGDRAGERRVHRHAHQTTKLESNLRGRGGVVRVRGGERRRREGYFPPDVDKFKLVLRPTYVTSWGVSEPPEKIFVLDSDGEAYAEFDVWNSDRSKRYPTFTLEGLLALAGTTLDGRNEVYVSENFTGELPLYRLTGVRLSLSFSFSNFRPMSHADPFNFQPQAKMTVKVSSEGSFVGSRETTCYTGPVGSFDQSGSVVGIRGVKMEYESQGLMGTPDGYTAMMALMSCFVMVGVATAIVDVIGAFIYDSFKDDKIEDDGERQHLEHMILNIETTGVPFKHDDLQVMPNVSVKDFLQMLQKDILKLSTLAHHMSRDLSQAGLNRHTVDIMSLDVSAAGAAGSTACSWGRTGARCTSRAGRRPSGADTAEPRPSASRTNSSASSPTRTRGSRSCGGYTPKTVPGWRWGAGRGRRSARRTRWSS